MLLRHSSLLLLFTAILPVACRSEPAYSPTGPFEPVQIADHLYYVGSAGLSSFLLTSRSGHILIDAPRQDNVPLVLANIRSAGFDPHDVRVLLATHAHFDHVGGLADMIDSTGGELWISEGDAPYIAAGVDFGMDTLTDGYPPAETTRTIKHLEQVLVGEITLTAHVTPGHTPGCTSWSGSVSIDGESLQFVLICSLTVIPYDRIARNGPTNEEQALDFCRSLAHLRTLNPDIFLFGHAQAFNLKGSSDRRRSGDRRAFVDATYYHRFLDGAEVAIDSALGDQGLGGCERVLR